MAMLSTNWLNSLDLILVCISLMWWWCDNHCIQLVSLALGTGFKGIEIIGWGFHTHHTGGVSGKAMRIDNLVE